MVKINYHETGVIPKIQKGEFSTPEYFKLNFISNKLLLKKRREELMTVDELKSKITLFPHQVKTALKFLNEMNGRILIADEVGMGKTIEAGIIIKELIAREEAKKILVLCPASLTLQWQAEMEDKFLINFEINKSVHHWDSHNMIISSLDTAKLEKHINEIKMLKWDLLIIDEAHKLKNRTTKAYKALQEINATNKLFLTATPIQNELMDLYNVIDLLDKQYLASTPHEFSKYYIKDKKGLEISNKNQLKDKLEGIMTRSTRRETGLEFTKRNVITTLIEESKEESEFSEIALKFIQDEYFKTTEDNSILKGVGTLQLMNLARMLTSCRYAFAKSFRNHLNNNVQDPILKEQGLKILELNEKMPELQKFNETIKLVKKIKDKIIIFTQFKTTQGELCDILSKNDFKTDIIVGGMSNEEKQRSIRKLKKGDIDVLVCTESGSEGLNMQFCHNLINYDLPWNPMRVEQRIGRIHRIGQQYDVNIYNLSIKGSVEEYILSRLYQKIDLFHQAIGDMADIITNVMDEESFEKTVFDILMNNKNKIDVDKKMKELFDKLKKSKEFQENIKKLDDKTLNVFDLSPIKNE